VRTHGPLEQSEFLKRMGIDLRVEMLKRGTERERWELIESGAKRLVDRSGMGREYVVLGITGGGGVRGEEWPFLRIGT
jgi:NADH dehydrogenase [ubiquinone] 1 alpha subcomplex assembly factor 7